MRALSITSLLIQACIVSAAIWPDGIGAEENVPAAFRIEISQPEYDGAGQAWTCLTAVLVQSHPLCSQCRNCRQSVPLILFGRPTLAQIEVRISLKTKRPYAEVYASLDNPRGWYRAHGGRADYFYLLLNTDGSFAKEIRLQYWGQSPGVFINPVRGPSPDESLAMKITPVPAR
jgi:hypothetical protein